MIVSVIIILVILFIIIPVIIGVVEFIKNKRFDTKYIWRYDMYGIKKPIKTRKKYNEEMKSITEKQENYDNYTNL